MENIYIVKAVQRDGYDEYSKSVESIICALPTLEKANAAAKTLEYEYLHDAVDYDLALRYGRKEQKELIENKWMSRGVGSYIFCDTDETSFDVHEITYYHTPEELL